jgi:hypothetical protein
MQVFPARLRLRHRVAEKEKTYTRNWWRGKNVRACSTPAYLSQLVTSVYGYRVLWMTNTHKDSSRPKQTSSRKLKRWSFTAFWRDSMLAVNYLNHIRLQGSNYTFFKNMLRHHFTKYPIRFAPKPSFSYVHDRRIFYLALVRMPLSSFTNHPTNF